MFPFRTIIACFGAWDLGPQHGFARNSPWTLTKGPEKVSPDINCVINAVFVSWNDFLLIPGC